jgi:hypothetical protein
MMLGVSYDEDEIEEKPKRAMLKKLKRENDSVSAAVPIEPMAALPQVEEVVEQAVAVEAIVDPVEEAVVEIVEEKEEPQLPEIVVDEEPIFEVVSQQEEVALPEQTTPHVEVVDQIEEVAPAPLAQPIVEPQRNMQDLFGARPRAQLDSEHIAPLIERGHEIVRKPSKKGRSIEFDFKTLVKPVAGVLLSIVGVYLLVGPGGIRFTLPEGGLRTSLSTAENALVIVRESTNYQIGDTVVAAVLTPEKPDYFASIAAKSDTEFVLTENNLYHSALREDVHGKVLLVMPGVGYFLHKLGL